MYGSYAITRMSNASARFATSLPILPSPISPSVLPRTSVPEDDFSHFPSRSAASIFGTCRASASISANVCSATLTAFPPGVLITSTPRRVASCRSMLSTPTPARPTARSLGALSSSAAVTRVALRTISERGVELILTATMTFMFPLCLCPWFLPWKPPVARPPARPVCSPPRKHSKVTVALPLCQTLASALG